jgi:hypothetical protein
MCFVAHWINSRFQTTKLILLVSSLSVAVLCGSQLVNNNRKEFLALVLLISLLVCYYCSDTAVELSVRMSSMPGL